MRALPVVPVVPVVVAAAMALFSTGAEAAPRPKLGVMLVFDQLPSWLLDRTAPFYGMDGFGGLDGAHYDAFYPYASTETAPGHATLATCAAPVVHGIATNSWFHNGHQQYVTDDENFPIHAPTGADPAARLKRGSSPRMLLVPTLADAMKIDSNGLAKVVTVSHKDRAAILTGGKSADLAIWYDRELGRYTSSTAYVDQLPDWLIDAGGRLPLQSRASGTWEALPAPKGLEHLMPLDDRPGENGIKSFGPTFPHHLKDIPANEQANGYRQTPQSMEDLFALALIAVDEMKLGQDDVADLLVVSISTTDVVGHNYGGDSLEQLDLLRRADKAVRAFRAELRKRVGKDIVIAMSSDHGAPSLPQSINAAGFDVGTMSYDVVEALVTDAVKKVAPKKDGSTRFQGFYPPQLFIDTADLDVAGEDRVLQAVRDVLVPLPTIAHVYDMRLGKPDEDGFHWLMRNSAPPDRAASIFVRTQPRVVMMPDKTFVTGTDHGTPYTYDRRVPFLLSGPGVKRGRYAEAVDTRDVSASLAFALGVSPPDACQGHAVSAVGQR